MSEYKQGNIIDKFEKNNFSSGNRDKEAIEKAKQQIREGKLATPENIRSAARNILKFGI
jgi:hypothetical protein